jgi:predicted phage-related endonuclease
MNSEKVKEIRIALCQKRDLSCILNGQLKVVTNEDILTLINELEKCSEIWQKLCADEVALNTPLKERINELESKNKELNNELKKYKMDWLNSEKMHLQADMEDTEFELFCANKSLDEVRADNKKLKDRIAELENIGLNENITVAEYLRENEKLKQDLKKSIDMQKQMLDGFKTATKEVEENLAREIPNLLKQFVERLKEKFYYEGRICRYIIDSDVFDETLKEFINEE